MKFSSNKQTKFFSGNILFIMIFILAACTGTDVETGFSFGADIAIVNDIMAVGAINDFGLIAGGVMDGVEMHISKEKA